MKRQTLTEKGYPPRTGRLLAVLAVLYLLAVPWGFLMPWERGFIHLAMVWNLFLATVPLGPAMLAFRRERSGKHVAGTAACLLLWLLFYPNAPYLLTDFLHMDTHTFWAAGYGFLPDVVSWAGLMHITVTVLAGCTCGMLSLYLVHCVVRRRFGKTIGWLFVAAVSAAAGVGIYLGRFIRFNTWDVVLRPWRILEEVVGRLDRGTMALYLIFAAMTWIPYALFYAAFAEE